MHRLKQSLSRGLTLLAALSIIGCDDTEFPNNLPEATAVEGDGIEAVKQIVSNSCLNGCHDATTALAGLDLETDLCDATVDVDGASCGTPMVVPGDAEASLFFQKVADLQDCGGPMPPAGAISDESIDIIEFWINDGANCDDSEEGE